MVCSERSFLTDKNGSNIWTANFKSPVLLDLDGIKITIKVLLKLDSKKIEWPSSVQVAAHSMEDFLTRGLDIIGGAGGFHQFFLFFPRDTVWLLVRAEKGSKIF